MYFQEARVFVAYSAIYRLTYTKIQKKNNSALIQN